MRSFTGPQNTLLASGTAIKRVFLAQTYNVSQVLGLWDGDFQITVSSQIYQPMNGFADATTLNVTQVSDGSIPGLTATFPGISGTPFVDLIRSADTWHQRPSAIYLGLFDPASPVVLVGGLIPWFFGFCDKATLTDGAPGEASTLRITFESIAREMTRNNLSVRSNYDQRQRLSSDDGMRTVGAEKNLQWGTLLKPQQIRRRKRRLRRSHRLSRD